METFNEQLRKKSHKKEVPVGVKFQCPICKKLAGRKDTTRTHMKRSHPDQSNLPIDEVQHWDLAAHLFFVEGQEGASTVISDLEFIPPPKSMCPICSQLFTRRDSVRKHMRKLHPTQADMPIPMDLCQYCHQTFVNTAAHERDHCDQNPDSKFIQKRLLKMGAAKNTDSTPNILIAPPHTSKPHLDDQASIASSSSSSLVGSAIIRKKNSKKKSKNSKPHLDDQTSIATSSSLVGSSGRSSRQFEKDESKILHLFREYLIVNGDVATSVMRQYYSMAKRFFAHCEAAEPLFIADAVLAMNLKPRYVQLLPGISSFLKSMPTISTKQNACKMYAKLTKFLLEYLLCHFKEVCSTDQYDHVKFHLDEVKEKANKHSANLNMRAEKARLEKNREKSQQADTDSTAERFLNSEYMAELKREYLSLTPAKVDAMSKEDKLRLRNYVMANLLMGGGNQGDALRNMTVYDFKNAVLNPKTGTYSVNVLNHKKKSGEEVIVQFLSKTTWKIATLYLKFVRPELVERQSVGLRKNSSMFGKKFEADPSKGEDGNPLFLSKDGHYMVSTDIVVKFIKMVLKDKC